MKLSQSRKRSLLLKLPMMGPRLVVVEGEEGQQTSSTMRDRRQGQRRWSRRPRECPHRP